MTPPACISMPSSVFARAAAVKSSLADGRILSQIDTRRLDELHSHRHLAQEVDGGCSLPINLGGTPSPPAPAAGSRVSAPATSGCP